MSALPIIYIRGFAGPTSGIDEAVDDPFYGFNAGSTHVRVNGDGDPSYYQFEGPLLRLVMDHGYHLFVHGDQLRFLRTSHDPVPADSIWVHRFYDSAATTFAGAAPKNLGDRVREAMTSDGFTIEQAARDLYDLIELVLERTGAPKVHLVAHSMGGLVARCMIQKVCQEHDDRRPRRPAREVVAKLFTFGTPHGGIETVSSIANWAMDRFGPAGSDIFSPRRMYGYLTPGASFGDVPADDDGWDPQAIPPEVFDVDDVFCLIGTDPTDYGSARLAVGPKSDGLVLIEHAYVRGAHRAFVYKSHSGRYGEVNSEEGYQNLRRFLFGRWSVSMAFSHLVAPGSMPPTLDRESWQADMKLAVRGIPVVMSQQRASQWCPIQLNAEVSRKPDSVDHPVPIISSFLLAKAPIGGAADVAAQLCRYVLTLSVSKLVEVDGEFEYRDHLEEVPDWTDSLIVDVGPGDDGRDVAAWTGWNSELIGAIDTFPRMPDALVVEAGADGGAAGSIRLPAGARALPIFGEGARLRVVVLDREAVLQPA